MKENMCRPVCCFFYSLCGVIYTAAGSVQLVAGIFFLFSLPVFKIGSNIWTGTCDVFIGVGTFMLCCFGNLSTRRTLGILYLALFALVLNVINLVVLEVGEWYFFMTDEVKEVIDRKNLHELAFYAEPTRSSGGRLVLKAKKNRLKEHRWHLPNLDSHSEWLEPASGLYTRISTSVTTGIVIVVAFGDCLLTFCALQFLKRAILGLPSTNETVSDIEYIIPRSKTRSASSNKAQSVNQYTQSWVYDAETGVCSANDSPCMKPSPSAPYPVIEQQHYSSASVVQVQVAEVTKHHGDGDRQINHMKSFSRTPSPAEASQSSSSSSIPPIYECLERLTQPTVYRSRLSLYRNANDAAGHPNVRSRVQSGDKEQYASLMVELENAFSHKKEPKTTLYTVPPSCGSKCSTVQSGSLWNESAAESADSRQRGSDAEFSKELEAALKLIQDLESPNTIETPSESCKAVGGNSLSKRRKSRDDKNDSDSSKTLSGSGSLEAHGKNHKTLPVESQSTSGYNSPSLDRSSRFTPTTGLSSCDLSASQDNGLSCVIRHLGDTAVISLFSPTKQPHPFSSADKISDVASGGKDFTSGTERRGSEKRTKSLIELKTKSFDGDEKFAKGKSRKWRHFIERKRRPSLLPEVESAIVKSESLAFLTKSELKDRLNQTISIHRQIEAKVNRQRSLRKADSFGSVEDIIDRYGVSTCL